MKRTLAACLIATAHCATPLPVFAQSEEIRALQQQIADLEAQNRRIMAQVAELSAHAKEMASWSLTPRQLADLELLLSRMRGMKSRREFFSLG